MGQGSPSGTVSHAIYHPLVYKLLLLVHEVHLKRFYEKQHDFIFGEKITMWTVWFSNTFQTNNIVVLFKFIILTFLKNPFLWRFSWKRSFTYGWRCFCRWWVNCWYCFQCFNQSKLFFVFTFLQKFAFKVLIAYHCWRRGLPVFPIEKLYPTIIDIFITWEWKRRDYFLSFIIWTTSNNTTVITHDLIYYHHSIILPIPHKQKRFIYHVEKVTADFIHCQLLSS